MPEESNTLAPSPRRKIAQFVSARLTGPAGNYVCSNPVRAREPDLLMQPNGLKAQ